MKKTLNVNAGTALLLNEQSETLSSFETISLNAGSIIANRKAYDKLLGMGASINGGSINIIDISGEIVELPGDTIITTAASFDGCYIICDGRLVIENAKGLTNINGLYASEVFYPESIDLNSIKRISAKRRQYPDNAKLHFGDMTIGEDSHIVLESTLYWVNGNITAFDGDALDKLRDKNTTFQCEKLIISTGLYEKFSGIFNADKYLFIPDDHVYTEDINLDAATLVIYGDKLYIHGDMMINHDQAQHLNNFSSLIVDGTVTMPISAAGAFKACGKARYYDLYEGILMSVNGNETIGHEQLQTAIRMGLCYTLNINGKMTFLESVTPEDIDAIAAIFCNGVIHASGKVRGILDTKIREMNGKIINIESEDEDAINQEKQNSDLTSNINAGLYRL